MTIFREYLIALLFAVAGILIAAYYFNQWLTGVVEQAMRFGR